MDSTPEKKRTAHPPKMGVASPRGKHEIQKAKEEQFDTSASGEEEIWDVGPNPVIETLALASVTLPPPAYQIAMKETSGSLSALQLETIQYVCQQHERQLPDGSRAGFYIGDGPGVGKGRTLSGIIYENYQQGRKRAIWVSVSGDLMYDALRDFKDIGAAVQIDVHPLKQIRCGDVMPIEGVVFLTYALLRSAPQSGNSRLSQLLQWCGEDFDGVIVFDECHAAKYAVTMDSMTATKTGSTVLELQNKLPKARIIYSSATGASEPKNMGYMVRLGLWGEGTPFKEFEDFVGVVEKGGVGTMEIVAMDMKHRGMYTARQLSFRDIEIKVDEVALSPEFIKLYDDSVKLWVQLLQSFTEAAELVNADQIHTTMWAQFWSAHQRFFKYLCIAAKVNHAVEVAREAVKCGKCVVIGLQATGEARTREEIENEGELSDFVSTAKGVLQALVHKHFPDRSKILQLASLEKGLKRKAECCSGVEPKKNCGSDLAANDITIEEVQPPMVTNPSALESKDDLVNRPPPKEALDMASSIKERLLAQIEQLGSSLPPNTLDQLIDELGGPDKVAEMTGRKRRVVQDDNGQVRYETRQMENINVLERQRFMAGEKLIAIISQVASSGISLQDECLENPRRRVHIVLELPWSAEMAIQQLGRTHRSHQASSPEYVILISHIAGERRFASIVAKRLESLGALTHGDRRATIGTELMQFHIDTKNGRAALDAIFKAVLGQKVPVVPLPADNKGDFFKDVAVALVDVGLIHKSDKKPGVTLDKDYANVTKFLNRILGMPVDIQNRLFQYFIETLEAIVNQAKKDRHVDSGIHDLGTDEDIVIPKKNYSFTTRHPTGSAEIKLQTFELKRGMSWDVAIGKFSVLSDKAEGFYISKDEFTAFPILVQLELAAHPGLEKADRLYTISQPNTGLLLRKQSLAEILLQFKKVQPDDAKPLWVRLFTYSETNCFHSYRLNVCQRKFEGKDCQYGQRQRCFNILSGSVLSVWTKVELVLSELGFKMKVVRLRSGGIRIVGTEILSRFMPRIIEFLKEESENVSEEVF